MLSLTIKDRIGIISLDRPDKRNAFNSELVESLHNAVVQLNEQNGVRAIVIKGNGPSFSAGADLDYIKQLRHADLAANTKDSRSLADMFMAIYNSPKLTISLVDGHALAGGCGLALVTDLCLASKNAQFGLTELRIGFVPAVIMKFIMNKLPGYVIKDMALTARTIEGEEALNLGLVNRLIDDADFEQDCLAYVREIIERTSPQALATTKELMRTVESLKLKEAIDLAVNVNAQARRSDDCIKGIDAFLNKERIKW